MTETQRGPGVLCLGRIYADLSFANLDSTPQLGREVYASNFGITPGGGAVITAAQLAGLGRPAELVGCLGLDPLASVTAESLAQLKVGLTHVERAENAGPQLTVAIVSNGDRAFVTKRAEQGFPADLSPAFNNQSVCHLHIGEFATLAECQGAIAAAKAAGLTVSLDPSWDESHIRGRNLLIASEGVDIFMPNYEEAVALTGLASPVDALDILAKYFPVVVLKCGRDPALLAVGTERFSAAAQSVTVVDTIGAGDSFNAGFLNAWLAGETPEACLKAGLRCGTASVQAAGGTGNL